MRTAPFSLSTTRFFEQNDDEAPSALVAIESADEGETWSQPREVVSAAPFGVKNVMSVSLLRLHSGEIGLFYIVKEAWYTRIMLARSDDEGRTFGRHAECTLPDRRGWFVLNNSRVERLHTGRILVPLAYHRTGLDERTGKFFFDPCACACMLYSDDDGATWSEAPDVIHPPFSGTRSGLQEPGVLELRDGALWAYFRTDKMYQYEAFSRDGGLHWSTPQASRFTSPLSPMKLLRQPDTGRLFAFLESGAQPYGEEPAVRGRLDRRTHAARLCDERRRWRHLEPNADDRGRPAPWLLLPPRRFSPGTEPCWSPIAQAAWRMARALRA